MRPRRLDRRPRGARHPALWATLALFALLPACGGADSGQEAAPEAGAPDAAADAAAAEEPRTVNLVDLGMDEGDPAGAAAAVIEFADFGCVHCAEFHVQTWEPLHEEFVATGDIFWKYVPITLGGFPNGDLAAYAGVCAHEADAFDGMRDRLFDNREGWMAMGEAEARASFVTYAEELGLDTDAFETCLDADATAQRIEDNNTAAQQIGIRVTPTFLVGGQGVQGAVPLPRFREMLNAMLEQVRAEPAPPAEPSDSP